MICWKREEKSFIKKFELTQSHLYSHPGITVRCYMMAIDPICKMKVDEKNAKYTSVYEGKTYYFCAPGCKKEFDKNPKKYA
jgi:YHS domain-containing protein